MRLEYAIEVHPTCLPEDFPGASLGEFDSVVTGVGSNPLTAGENAYELFARHIPLGMPIEQLTRATRDLLELSPLSTCAKDEVQYVSIRWKVVLGGKDTLTS